MTVLAIFMLLERRELRDRLILLIGYRRMTATTKALDEAGTRISRYLLMQDADRQHLLAAGADHVETTVLDTQRTLALWSLTPEVSISRRPTRPIP